MSASGYEATKWIFLANVYYQIEKRTIPLNAAMHNEPFVGNVDFAMPRRKEVTDLAIVSC